MGIDIATHIYYGMLLENEGCEKFDDDIHYKELSKVDDKYDICLHDVHNDIMGTKRMALYKEAFIHSEWDLVPLTLPDRDQEDVEKRIRAWAKELGLTPKGEHPIWWITSYLW